MYTPKLPQGWAWREEAAYSYSYVPVDSASTAWKQMNVYLFDCGKLKLPAHAHLSRFAEIANSHGLLLWPPTGPEPMPEEIDNIQDAITYAYTMWRML